MRVDADTFTTWGFPNKLLSNFKWLWRFFDIGQVVLDRNMDNCDPRNMKLSDWARQVGVNYRTAWRWVRDGKLPEGVNAIRTGTGTILVNVPVDPDPKKAALFLLESDDEKEMSARSTRVLRWLKPYGYINLFVQIGPRSKLVRLLRTVKHKTIVVEASIADPFALELLKAALESSGRELLVFSDPRMTLKDTVR